MSSAEAAAGQAGIEQVAIGRQLHDIVVPQLFVLTTGLTALRRRHAELAEGDPLIGDLVDTATQALSDLRAISRGQPTHLESTLQGVVAHLRGETGAVRHLTECDIALVAEGDVEIPPALADDLVAFVWEAIANAIRHGGARCVALTFGVVSGDLVLRAEDDGCWQDPSNAAGTGLSGLQRRADRWGGRVAVVGSAVGTRVEWRVPLAVPDQWPVSR